MSFPLDKYHYYVADNKVIAVSTYAGKRIRGIAKCAPGDKFNLEIGKQLAAARCNEKVAMKRYARASAKYHEARKKAIEVEKHATEMRRYLEDAYMQMNEASQDIDTMIDSLEKI